MTWLPVQAPGADPLEQVFGLRPNLFAAWRDFAALFFEKGLVDPVLLELCRLRLAQMHGARHPLSLRTPQARAAGLEEERIAALERWWESDAFTPTERDVLRFAEQFALDPQGIGDAEAAAVTGALGDAGTVALVEALALFDGFARFARLLDVAPATEAGA